MEILTTGVPTWVSILFLLTIPIPILLMARLVKQGAINANYTITQAKQFSWMVILFYTIFLGYTAVLSVTGVFLKPSIPPKVVLFTTLPLLLFLLIVVSNLKVYKVILAHIAVEKIVALHIFRLIGSFFLILHFFNALPAPFAYIAGLGDITVALTSILVTRAIVYKKSYAKPLTIAWNILGMVDIISVLVAAIVTTKIAMDNGTPGVAEISKFPFSLIPSFAAATIMFLHISIFKKVFASNKKVKVLTSI
jgi:hypothetical protein